jgi:hypothetical protein
MIAPDDEILAEMRRELLAVVDSYVSPDSPLPARIAARKAMAQAAAHMMVRTYGPFLSVASIDQVARGVIKRSGDFAQDMADHMGTIIGEDDIKAGRVRR